MKAYFEFMILEGNPGNIEWEKGTLIYNQEFEAMYYHLIKFKEVCIHPDHPEHLPNNLFFSPNRIFFFDDSKSHNVVYVKGPAG